MTGLVQAHAGVLVVGLVLPWLLGLVVTAGGAARLTRRLVKKAREEQ